MKKLTLLLLMALVVLSCSKDETTLNENQENLTHNINTDLRKQLPNKAFDTDVRGTYAGVIVANNAQFHGKLWVNIGNDGHTNALVETVQGELINFSLADNATSISSNYMFENERGSFELNMSDYNNVEALNISIDETEGFIHVRKETNSNKRMVSLGTYDNSILGLTTGTWDIMTPGAGGIENIDAIMVTGAGGGMHVEDAVDMEGTTPQCYGGGPYAPFFWNDPTDNRYEIYATGQQLTLSNGMTVLFDFGFTKYLCDFNNLDYNRGLYMPEAVNGILFDDGMGNPLADGCYNIAGKGYYISINAAGDAYVSSGVIDFDTSALVPGFPNCNNGIMDGDETGVDCGGTCPACPDPLSEDNKVKDTPYTFLDAPKAKLNMNK